MTPQEPPTGMQRVAWGLFVAALAAHMLLSAQALLSLGYPYTAPFGPIVAKLHPGTYLLLLAWLLVLMQDGTNPLRGIAVQFREQPQLATYLVCMVLVFVWVVLRHGTSGAAFIVDTLLMPAIAAFVLLGFAPQRQATVVPLVMGLLGCNALLALAEASLQTRLFSLDLGRSQVMLQEAHFRSSAFIGHPLLNALVTVTLIPAVTLLRWPAPWKLGLLLALMLSVLAFGGRVSLMLGVAIYGSYLLWRVLSDTVHGRYTYLQLTGGSVALTLLAALLVGVVASTGLGERIFQNLVFDSSASVRLKVWEALAYLSATDAWFGIPPSAIDHITVLIGLDPTYEAIENFWIYLFMQFGVIGYLPFIVGLGCLIARLWRAATPPMRLAVLFFFVSGSTGNTLAAKSAALLLLVVVVLAGRASKAAATAAPAREALAGWTMPPLQGRGAR